jgi:hypothetical protein
MTEVIQTWSTQSFIGGCQRFERQTCTRTFVYTRKHVTLESNATKPKPRWLDKI